MNRIALGNRPEAGQVEAINNDEVHIARRIFIGLDVKHRGMKMIPLLDFQQRSLNGPVMKASDFDIAFSMKIRELVKKHGIKYKPEGLIVDDETADAIFHAGVELLAEVGLYQLDTHRVVQYSQEEIFGFAEERKQNPGEAVFGLGDDEMTIAFRKGSDPRPPTLYVGIAGEITEEEFVPLATSFVREKKIKKGKPLPEIKPEEIPFEIPEKWHWCRLMASSGSTGTDSP